MISACDSTGIDIQKYICLNFPFILMYSIKPIKLFLNVPISEETMIYPLEAWDAEGDKGFLQM